ncbi:GspH/FimT family pseudopilin [Stenotrophomonas rhizophila]|uniref:GspH/FimT family pseudopilin n=1 Tax=Stenotrophomonas rhizophila TaxID=216778 RepID=UPI002A69CA8B|nr:GspH/FimT family pseudopilin [Stenotrophomonas rhizophila]MDY0953427.1 GspH/FimT family pseudopilin [Stenotrophomonas rhizophila]
MSMRPSKGFTLVELMVTVAVVAILSAIAYPSFQGTLRSNRLAAGHNELLGLVNLARSEAIRNSRGGGVCGSSDGNTCDGAWGVGMMAFSDIDHNGLYGTGDTVLRFNKINSGLVVQGPTAPIAFDGRGRRKLAADQVLVMRPDKCGTQSLLRTVTINASGQISAVKGACP